MPLCQELWNQICCHVFLLVKRPAIWLLELAESLAVTLNLGNRMSMENKVNLLEEVAESWGDGAALRGVAFGFGCGSSALCLCVNCRILIQCS